MFRSIGDDDERFPQVSWPSNFMNENLFTGIHAGFSRRPLAATGIFVNKQTRSLLRRLREFCIRHLLSLLIFVHITTSGPSPLLIGHVILLTKIIYSRPAWILIGRDQASAEPSPYFRQQNQAAPEVPLSSFSNCAVPYQFL